MKKMLDLKERVDILIEVGTDQPQKWMSVHGYEDPAWSTNNPAGWATEWRRLRTHHVDETTFLFQVIEELRNRLKELK